jgi:hypothetical protein
MSDDIDPQDQLAALRATLDQAIASAPEIARDVHGYYQAFKAEGFSDPQALYLAVCTIQQKPGTAP